MITKADYYARLEKWDRRFLSLARHIAGWSKDPSTKCGAVVVNSDLSIVSVGYNGFPRGVVDSPDRLNDRETKYKMVVHAERNALLFARQAMDGCTLYVWPLMTCSACAGMAIQCGITRHVASVNDNPRWAADQELSAQMYREAAVTVDLLQLPPNDYDEMLQTLTSTQTRCGELLEELRRYKQQFGECK